MNNKQKEEFNKKFGMQSLSNLDVYIEVNYGTHLDDIFDWINQNYISKEQILNLECLKEELIFPLKDNLMTEFAKNTRNDLKLEIIEEIKKEITKDLFKDFKQVSNPLDEDYE